MRLGEQLDQLRDPEYDELLEEARQTADNDARYELYAGREDPRSARTGAMPMTPIYWYTYTQLERPSVQDSFNVNLLAQTDLTEVVVKEERWEGAAAGRVPRRARPAPPASDRHDRYGDGVLVETLAAALICLDPGHGTAPEVGRQLEPIGPGSGELKLKDGGGAAGEAPVALAIARRTRVAARARGFGSR